MNELFERNLRKRQEQKIEDDLDPEDREVYKSRQQSEYISRFMGYEENQHNLKDQARMSTRQSVSQRLMDKIAVSVSKIITDKQSEVSPPQAKKKPDARLALLEDLISVDHNPIIEEEKS